MTELLVVTAIMMVLDLATGFAGAVKTNTVKSCRMRDGLWHKAGFVGMITLAYILQYAAAVADLGITVPAVSAVCIFVILTEAVSVLENLCILNPQIANSPIGKVFSEVGSNNGEVE